MWSSATDEGHTYVVDHITVVLVYRGGIQSPCTRSLCTSIIQYHTIRYAIYIYIYIYIHISLRTHARTHLPACTHACAHRDARTHVLAHARDACAHARVCEIFEGSNLPGAGLISPD